MACLAQLFNPATNKTVTSWYIDKSYREAQEDVDKKNLKIQGNKTGSYWKITEINR